MITARELASEVGASVSDVLDALNDMHELTLGPDSGVRDTAADAVRQRLRSHPHASAQGAAARKLASDEQLQLLRDRLAGSAASPPQPVIDLTPPERHQKAETKIRTWRPGHPPLQKMVQALADQIVRWSHVEHRPPGVIFGDEVAEAMRRAEDWERKRIAHGAFLSDDDIVNWIRAFPNEILRPEEVYELALAGLTPQTAQLRLWYGRINNGRLTLLQQIRRGDLSVEKAVADVSEHKRRRSGA
jgi:hypothetical protein